jgi:hypothetical protein
MKLVTLYIITPFVLIGLGLCILANALFIWFFLPSGCLIGGTMADYSQPTRSTANTARNTYQ